MVHIRGRGWLMTGLMFYSPYGKTTGVWSSPLNLPIYQGYECMSLYHYCYLPLLNWIKENLIFSKATHFICFFPTEIWRDFTYLAINFSIFKVEMKIWDEDWSRSRILIIPFSYCWNLSASLKSECCRLCIMIGKTTNLGSLLKLGVSLKYKTALKLFVKFMRVINVRNNVVFRIRK
jgi:hypothetical protein